VRPLIVGLVHGLAGSAAVALLVLTTIQNPKWAIAYLLVFGIGTIAGMMLITGAMVLPFAYANKRFSRLNEGLRIASGLISVAFGLFLVYEIGFVNGLLTSHPHWTPR
jgi:high-affinity nickel-transport protein